MYSNHEKIFIILYRTPGRWLKASDLIKFGEKNSDLYLGYEATARMSEVARMYPHLIERQRDGRFFEQRFIMSAETMTKCRAIYEGIVY